MTASGVLFVDDDLDNVRIIADILADALDEPVLAVATVEEAVEALLDRNWRLVVMDVFIPLGSHPRRILSPRATGYQDQVDHLGGLVLLEELDRLDPRPVVMSHTACTDHVLFEIFGERVVRAIPKPAPLDMLLRQVVDVLNSEA